MTPLFYAFAAMSLAWLAAALAVWCFVRARKLLRGASSRSLALLNEAVTELDFGLKSLEAQHKRLNSRVAMREARSKLEDSPQQTTPAPGSPESKIKLREIARGQGFKLG